jgi:hypothetical protein
MKQRSQAERGQRDMSGSRNGQSNCGHQTVPWPSEGRCGDHQSHVRPRQKIDSRQRGNKTSRSGKAIIDVFEKLFGENMFPRTARNFAATSSINTLESGGLFP